MILSRKYVVDSFFFKFQELEESRVAKAQAQAQAK